MRLLRRVAPHPKVATLVAAGLLVAQSPGPPRAVLKFDPPRGTILEKGYRRVLHLELEDLALVTYYGDQEGVTVPSHNTTATSFEKLNVHLSDEYILIENGQPLRIRRTFEQLRNRVEETTPERPGPVIREGVGILEDESVLFSREKVCAGFEPIHEGENYVDPVYLKVLVEDTDLRGFLPSGSVSIGDSWRVDPAEIRSTINPGGALSFFDKGGDLVPPGTCGELHGNFEGTLQAELLSIEENEHAAIARVGLRGELESESHTTQSDVEVALVFVSGRTDIERTSRFALNVEGVLEWNVGAGHLHTAKIDTDVSMRIESSGALANGEVRFEKGETWRGTLRFECNVGDDD